MFPTSKLYAISLLAAVGVAGFAAGAATMSRAETRKSSADFRERCSYSGMLNEALHLSTVQRDSIRAIMRSHRPEMHAIIAPVRAQMDSARTRLRDEIRAVLTPEQRTRYDEMMARERARWDSAAPGQGTRAGTH